LTERDEGRSRDPTRSVGRNIIEPFLLLELLGAPSYGYDLIRRMAERGFRRATAEPAVVYKVLRSLEDSGAIHSTWSPQESGPARRYYEITEEGRTRLRQRVGYLRRYVERLERLLADYATLTGEDPGTEMPAEGAPPPVPATAGVPK
jgi:DNA-binding PadR family transcriptional regulator